VQLIDGVAGVSGIGQYGRNRELVVRVDGSGSPNALVVGASISLNGNEGDTYVLSVSYDETSVLGLFGSETAVLLGWQDGGAWKSAVTGNTGGVAAFVGNRPYDSSTDFHLGKYGVDTAANTVWAVINHDGTFGVIGDSAPPAGAYQIWAAAAGIATTPDPIRDTDGDGVVDLLEYAFNLDPKTPRVSGLPAEGGSSGLPWVGLSGAGDAQRLRVSFLRRTGAMAAGLSYEVEFAASLAGPWAGPTVPLVIFPIDTSWELVVAEDPVSAVGSLLRFGRVRVRIAP
jgi:hypothetical protein